MTKREIEIRRVAITCPDAENLILSLNQELLSRYPEDGTVHHFRLDAGEVAPGRGAFFVAYADGKAIACGAIRRIAADTAEIKRMYVAPEARGAGLGRRLLETLETEARALGAKTVVLETGVRQEDAITLYSAAGYARIGAFGEYEEHPLSVFLGKSVESSEPRGRSEITQ